MYKHSNYLMDQIYQRTSINIRKWKKKFETTESALKRLFTVHSNNDENNVLKKISVKLERAYYSKQRFVKTKSKKEILFLIPLNKKGKISWCIICDSKIHWAKPHTTMFVSMPLSQLVRVGDFCFNFLSPFLLIIHILFSNHIFPNPSLHTLPTISLVSPFSFSQLFQLP